MQAQAAEVSGSSCIVLPVRTSVTVVRFAAKGQHFDKMHRSVYSKLAILEVAAIQCHLEPHLPTLFLGVLGVLVFLVKYVTVKGTLHSMHHCGNACQVIHCLAACLLKATQR